MNVDKVIEKLDKFQKDAAKVSKIAGAISVIVSLCVIPLCRCCSSNKIPISGPRRQNNRKKIRA